MPPLLHRIANAFPVTEPPAVLSRYPRSDVDDTKFFVGKGWQELSAAELRANSDAVEYFTAEALAYFAPAYMTAYLSDARALDMAVESFLLSLGGDPGNASARFQRAHKVWSLFDSEQRETVKEFIHHYGQVEGTCAMEEVEQALQVYGAIVQSRF